MNKDIIKTNPVASFALVIALLAAGYAFWRSSGEADLQREIETKQAEASRLSDNVRYAQKLDTNYDRLVQLNKELTERLTDPSDLASNQQYFYKIESATGVKINDLRQVTLPKKKGAGPALSFNPVPYTINVTGTYPQLLAFVRGLESGSRLCRLTGASIAAPAKDTTAVGMTLTINAEFAGNI